ncbi:MAG: type IV pili methyl-accepting chemotaxis transducer N-terminal domain-containing protein [Pseudomonadota bacterium]
MPGKNTQTAVVLKTAFTKRYCLALSLVFCILLSTLLIFSRQTSIAENDAYIINISGMQRMLSQRIALMAKEIRRSKNQEEADEYADKLQQAIQRMYSNHIALSTGQLSPNRSYTLSSAVEDTYFGETALDQRVRTYILAAKSYLELYQEQGLDVIKGALRAEDNVAYARTGLLTDLDATVKLYEAEAKSRIQSFQRLEIGFFVVGLLILIGEVLFIFQPMVRMIVMKTGALEKTNTELVKLSQKLVEKHSSRPGSTPASQ